MCACAVVYCAVASSYLYGFLFGVNPFIVVTFVPYVHRVGIYPPNKPVGSWVQRRGEESPPPPSPLDLVICRLIAIFVWV